MLDTSKQTLDPVVSFSKPLNLIANTQIKSSAFSIFDEEENVTCGEIWDEEEARVAINKNGNIMNQLTVD